MLGYLLDKSCNIRWSTYVELCVIGLRKILRSKKDTFLSPEIGVYKITFYKQKKWNVSTYKALFILIKLNVLLNEINVFLCYTCFKNQFNCWAESLLNEHNFNVFLPGADPEFFLGGAALVVTDWWRKQILMQKKIKPQVISAGRRCAPPAPSPYIRPCLHVSDEHDPVLLQRGLSGCDWVICSRSQIVGKTRK